MEILCASCGDVAAVRVNVPACFAPRIDLLCSNCDCDLEYFADLTYKLSKEG